MDIPQLRKQFESTFGRPAAGACRAPGRVNLIGEHTDYNGGFVLPIAIARQTVALYAPRAGRTITFVSSQSAEPVSVELDKPITAGEPKWGNYVRGTVACLLEKGIPLAGADMLLSSDVPLGGGLSSSASLEVAVATALLEMTGSRGAITDGDLAKACQKAENVYAGAPCGIMDQSIAVMGKAGHALLLDCLSGQTRQVPFSDPSLVLLVADTQVRHDIGDGGYPLRRRQCSSAAAKLGVDFLRNADEDMIARAAKTGALDEQELMRSRHAVSEIQRTLWAVEALDAGDYKRFGQLMYASHESLRYDFEVSCEELDTLVDAARACPGVYGARMTGGGFGGCAIFLCQADHAEPARGALSAAFEARFGRPCPIFATTACDGAGPIDDNGQ